MHPKTYVKKILRVNKKKGAARSIKTFTRATLMYFNKNTGHTSATLTKNKGAVPHLFNR